MSAFGDLSTIAPQQLRDGVRTRSVHGERVTLALIELEPDAVVPEHAHDNEQLGILLDGSLRFRIGEETRILGRGETWCIASNVRHEAAAGSDGAVIVEVFAPPRTDWHALADAPGASRWP